MEFLARPNLPNSLANSLVQLAAHQNDPLVAGIENIGKLADQYSERQNQQNLLDKQAKIQDERDQKAHERAMDITRMELAHKDKERQSKLVADLLPLLSKAEAKDMTAADAERLATPGFQGPLKSSGQFQPPKPGEISGEVVGLPRGYNITPEKKFVITPEIAENNGLDKSLIGETATKKDLLAMGKAQVAAKGKEAAATVADKKQTQLMENQFRDELDKKSSDFDDLTSAYSKIRSLSKNPSAAGDMSLIFAYMKILDPKSTVREGEQAQAEQARGVPASILAQYNKAVSGEKLAPEQRADFVGQAEKLYVAEKSLQGQRDKDATDKAERNKLDPKNILSKRGIIEDDADPAIGLTGDKATRLIKLRKDAEEKKAKVAKK